MARTEHPFINGEIDGVVVKPLKRFNDSRGWLVELFRNDELEEVYWPAMSYVSATLPGVVRGPHEHREQADLFCFIGTSDFLLHLWDNRPASATYRRYWCLKVDLGNPTMVVVPPGVVHVYKNVADVAGIVFNAPNQLYAGWGKKEVVDEIRHEQEPGSVFLVK